MPKQRYKKYLHNGTTNRMPRTTEYRIKKKDPCFYQPKPQCSSDLPSVSHDPHSAAVNNDNLQGPNLDVFDNQKTDDNISQADDNYFNYSFQDDFLQADNDSLMTVNDNYIGNEYQSHTLNIPQRFDDDSSSVCSEVLDNFLQVNNNSLSSVNNVMDVEDIESEHQSHTSDILQIYDDDSSSISNEILDVTDGVNEVFFECDGWPNEDPANAEFSTANDSDDSIHHSCLQSKLCHCTDSTIADLLFICISLGIRHSLPWIVITDFLKAVNTLYNRDVVPTSKYFLFKYFNCHVENVNYHSYCPNTDCKTYLGLKIDNIICPNCKTQCNTGSAPFFAELNIESQLNNILKIPEVQNNINYKTTRDKTNINTYEDIQDGKEYLKLSKNGGPLENTSSLSFIFNTDGCQSAKYSKTSVWPIYIMLTDLPPKLRSKYILLVGLWCDTKKPDMNSYLASFVKQFNQLSAVGITWYKAGVKIVSKVIPLLCTADTPARIDILGKKQFNAYFGCIYCEHPTEKVGRCRKYPISTKVPLARETNTLKKQMLEVHERNVVIRGIRRVSSLICLKYFDLIKGLPVDYLHAVLLGVVRRLSKLHISSTSSLFYIGDKIEHLNARLLSIRPPKIITRTPRDMSELKLWRGNEFRTYLLFYSLPCLDKILPQKYLRHFSLLVYAINILLQKSITKDELTQAKHALIHFVVGVQRLYGKSEMTSNVHSMLHLCDGTENWGPEWTHNTLPFENQNRLLLNMVQSPSRIIPQVIRRVSMFQSLPGFASQHPINHKTQKFCEQLFKSKLNFFSSCKEFVLIGSGKKYILNEAEKLTLNNTLSECLSYEKIIYNNIRFTTSSYSSGKKNDDSVVELTNDTFGRISKICKFGDECSNSNVIIFLNLFKMSKKSMWTNDSFKITHIKKCINENDKLIAISPNQLRKTCIFMKIDNCDMYVAQIPFGCFND